jgi:hypothetical protein
MKNFKENIRENKRLREILMLEAAIAQNLKTSNTMHLISQLASIMVLTSSPQMPKAVIMLTVELHHKPPQTNNKRELNLKMMNLTLTLATLSHLNHNRRLTTSKLSNKSLCHHKSKTKLAATM